MLLSATLAVADVITMSCEAAETVNGSAAPSAVVSVHEFGICNELSPPHEASAATNAIEITGRATRERDANDESDTMAPPWCAGDLRRLLNE